MWCLDVPVYKNTHKSFWFGCCFFFLNSSLGGALALSVTWTLSPASPWWWATEEVELWWGTLTKLQSDRITAARRWCSTSSSQHLCIPILQLHLFPSCSTSVSWNSHWAEPTPEIRGKWTSKNKGHILMDQIAGSAAQSAWKTMSERGWESWLAAAARGGGRREKRNEMASVSSTKPTEDPQGEDRKMFVMHLFQNTPTQRQKYCLNFLTAKS